MSPNRKCKRPSTPSGTYLPSDLPNPPIYSKTNPADAPILTLALTSNTLPLSKVEDLADTRLAQKISQLSGVGLVSISGGQKPAVRIQANPTSLSSYGLTLEDVRAAISHGERQPGQGQFRRSQPGLHDRRQRSATLERQLPSADRRLSQRRPGPSLRRRHGRRRRGKRQAGGLDERRAGGDSQHPAAARRQHHRGGRSRQGAAAAAARFAAGVGADGHPHRPHHHDSRVGRRRAVRTDAHHRAGRHGDLPVPAEPLPRPSFPASRCRFRWSARSA